jgi:hypothetical protein
VFGFLFERKSAPSGESGPSLCTVLLANKDCASFSINSAQEIFKENIFERNEFLEIRLTACRTLVNGIHEVQPVFCVCAVRFDLLTFIVIPANAHLNSAKLIQYDICVVII